MSFTIADVRAQLELLGFHDVPEEVVQSFVEKLFSQQQQQAGPPPSARSAVMPLSPVMESQDEDLLSPAPVAAPRRNYSSMKPAAGASLMARYEALQATPVQLPVDDGSDQGSEVEEQDDVYDDDGEEGDEEYETAQALAQYYIDKENEQVPCVTDRSFFKIPGSC
jgi:hypothetical protein